ncbi:hypothetical protein [Stenotrophomonas sp. NPDC078853]|uniref:hypothetical protein n=1 Tax=Stenotrophomonas sp. NPDC078853 TaxID=3364534 RepID=UPI00385175A7
MSEQMRRLNDDLTEWLRERNTNKGDKFTVGDVMAGLSLGPAHRPVVAELLDVWLKCGFVEKFGAREQLTAVGFDILYPESTEEAEAVVRADILDFLRVEGLKDGHVFISQKYLAERRDALNPRQREVIQDVIEDLIMEDLLARDSRRAIVLTAAGVVALS